MLIARSDLLRALSLDSQARLTTDPNRPVRLGVGNGVRKVFDTPFLEATTLKGYLEGNLISGTTMKKAAGAGGLDQIKFAAAPGSGRLVSVSADGLAINTVVLDEAISQAEQMVQASVQSAGYAWPVTGNALESVTPLIVGLVKWLLRDRRDLDDRADMPEWIRMQLTRIANGEWKLPPGTRVVSESASSSRDSLSYGSDEPVFTRGWL